MLLVVATIAAAAAVGVAAERRTGALAVALARRLLEVMLFVLAPFASFVNVAHLEVTADIRGGVVAGWLALVLAGAAGWLLGRRVLDLPPPSAATLATAGLVSNTGYLGLPLCAALLGPERLPEAFAYDAIVQSPVFLIGAFAVAAATGTRAGDTPRRRVVSFFSRNPPLLATIAGLVAPASLAPAPLVDAAHIVVFAMLPIGFFAVGATMAAEAGGRFPPPFTAPVGVALVLRLVLAPLLLVAIAAPFIDLPASFLLLSAMPVGLNAITLAHVYGLDLRLAAGTVAWSTAVAASVGLAVSAVV